MKIHATAIVDTRARIAPDVEIGPYAVVGPDVEIGAGCSIGSHAVVTGHTCLGQRNRIFPFAAIGGAPQDKKYRGEPTRLEIGEGNTIREYCTFNCGTAQDVGVTRVGDDNWFMAYVHVAHDCQVGSHTVFANATQLAGHVHVGDYVYRERACPEGNAGCRESPFGDRLDTWVADFFAPARPLLAANGALLVTMLVSGLWHGTTLAFLLFGLAHGLYQVVYRSWDTFLVVRLGRKRVRALRERLGVRLAGMALTFNATAFAFVFFRVDTERLFDVAVSWLGAA